MGGGAGSLARYLAASAIMTRLAPRFPPGTMVINITGSFLIGLIMTLLIERFQLHENWRLTLVPGRLHDVLELRMGDLFGGSRRRLLDGPRQRLGERLIRLLCRVAGRADRAPLAAPFERPYPGLK